MRVKFNRRVLDENNKYFKEEQEKLQKWADDIVKASEKELDDLKIQIREINRKLRMATTTEEQFQLQTKLGYYINPTRPQKGCPIPEYSMEVIINPKGFGWFFTMVQ